MAKNNGLEIDDIYRNENGISFQMRSMESAYCGKTIMKPATQLFNDVVTLYRTNRSEYEKILKEAKAMVDGKQTTEDRFMTWLSSKVSYAQLSGLLWAYKEVEQYCLKIKVLNASLFETTDFEVLKKVQKTVQQNKIFRITRRKQINKIDSAMQYYYAFIKESSFAKPEPAKLVTQPATTSILSPQKQATQSASDIKPQESQEATIELLVRNEQDKRLLTKYPIIYKRIFSALREISEDNPRGVTVVALYDYIKHIARCSDIEDILDNVSWARFDRPRYVFSVENIKHDENTEEQNGQSEASPLYEQLAIQNIDFNVNADFLYTKPAELDRGDAVQMSISQIPTGINKFYERVLAEHFQKGFRLGSPLEIRKFRKYYEAIAGEALETDDEEIERTIRRCGVLYEEKVFTPQTMLSEELKERLFSYIHDHFAEGKTTLYYQAIFKKFSEDFLDYYIYNTEMLKAYLTYMNDGSFYIGRSYLSKDANATSDPLKEIRVCLKEHATPMTYDEIFEDLSHIPQQKIRQILATNAEFVSNGRGEYFHVSAVNFSDEELDNITGIISYAINEKDFLSGNELVDAIEEKYPYSIEKNAAFSVVGLRDTIKYHLGDKFSFKGNIISRAGHDLSMWDVFTDFCRRRDGFSLDELNILASELGTTIYFDAVYNNSLRVNKDQFVSKEQAHFHVKETDTAIDRFCIGDYISIEKVRAFGAFPDAGFPWNSFLLEHYVAAYSEKFCLMHVGFNATKCVGAIVKRNAGIESFDDFIVNALASSCVQLKKQPALQYLCDEGYIARRIYNNIEELLIKATALRNRKESH